MTQGFYTAISGMGAAQTKIDVIADNIANMNTVGFKESNVVFENLFSRTLTVGNAPFGNVGGKNPMQVGSGAQISSIIRNFTNGNYQTTGRDKDLLIQGSGFFSVQDPNGETLLTRAGNFSTDAQGYLVNSSGYRVLGTALPFSQTSNNVPIFFPPELNMIADGNINMASAGITTLNNFAYKAGDVSMRIQRSSGPVDVTLHLPAGAATINDVITSVNTQLTAAGVPGVQLQAGTGTEAGTIKFVVNTTMGADPAQSIVNMTALTSNFFTETQLASAISTTSGTNVEYKSKILDFKATVSPPDKSDSTRSINSMSVGDDGAFEITYSNGDKLTVETTGSTRTLLYKTSSGVSISQNKITVNGNVIEPANLQLQLASVVNDQALISKGGNLFALGPNAGNITFSIGSSNGFGNVSNGGLESSNVDLPTQFAEMIIAQRSIEANSRTFDTINQILQRIVQLGR